MNSRDAKEVATLSDEIEKIEGTHAERNALGMPVMVFVGSLKFIGRRLETLMAIFGERATVASIVETAEKAKNNGGRGA